MPVSIPFQRRWLALTIAVLCAPAVFAQPQPEAAKPDASQGELSYLGAPFRVGVGYQTQNMWRGELLYVFRETDNTAWIADGYATTRSAGGARLSFHWQPADDKEAAVRKLFTAIDQNYDHDRKVTLGVGLESERWNGSLYGSAGITGRRQVGEDFFSWTQTVTGVENNHNWSQDITTTTLTRTFERAYDWGIGARAGRFYDSWALRWFGGVDYEWGKQSTSQITGTLGIEKFFVGTPHSVALVGEVYHKRGDYEVDKNDQRIMLMYRFSLGGPLYRPTKQYRDVQVEAPAAGMVTTAATTGATTAATAQPEAKKHIVKTMATAASDVFFKLDSAQLQPEASRALDTVARRLQASDIEGNIYITGHTCNLGTAAYNQKLSERRAESVFRYLVSKGIAADKMLAEGKGLHEPRYPNDKEGRPKNRRVDIEYLTFEDKSVTEAAASATPPPVVASAAAEPQIEWRREEIAAEPAWAKRALRSPADYKQAVDVYRTQEKTTTVSEGERIVENQPPVAVNDFAIAGYNQPVSVNVLANDHDPDGDKLMIVSFTQPRYGTVTQNGEILTYRAYDGYIGYDSFQYTITDGYGGFATATVTVYADP
ncbi:MAG: OmpA family protein [Burkholderiales bacterium]|jgi:outer membrane protein OmpA-like peptidoglycan-associated protein|nr:OmpA family protein [Burkholderiales bacterium]